MRPDARCPIRPGEPCTLCQLDVTGPQDCPLVYLVMTDSERPASLRNTPLPSRVAARVSKSGGSQ
jgi:hypothetical protein